MVTDWGSRATILVVDDDRNICTALQRQLGRAGYIVHGVNDGASALAFARDSVADLVILDLLMPGLNGIETCQGLRGLPGWADIPVLILTGTYEDELYREAMNCGADDFLTKPVRTEELLLRVKSLIRVRGLLSDLRTSAAAIEAQNEVILKNRATREKLEAFLLHDLKNPIAGILLQSELMIAQDPEGAVPWKRMLGAAEHLMKLVASWMDHIRADQTGIHPTLAPVDVRPFLDSILAHHELWLRVREIRGSVEVPPSLPPHPMDPSLMERVLGNLLDNCLRFSPDGGAIRLEGGAGPGGTLLLRVGDQGPGVPPEQRDTMFDLYAQMEAAPHRLTRHNRGLGLAFCKTAVESHGGTIRVEDNPGGGALFTIELPGRGDLAEAR